MLKTQDTTPSLLEYEKNAVAFMLNIEKIGREDADDSVTPSPKKGKKSKKGEHDHIQTGNDLGLILTERKVQKWKVLVLDQFCFDVLGPLFKVGDLRAMGVTLVMNINDKRQPIPDAPAVYFVRPTKDNIDIICKDSENDLYESIYVNFCGSNYKRDLLDDMATQMVQSESTHKISKLFDQYLNFFCVESNFFSLGLHRSLASIYDPTLKDNQIMDQLDTIASGLASVVLTMGASPLLAYARGSGGPASMVAEKLEKRLRNAAMSNIQQSALPDKNRRPIVIIVDRNIDYTVCLEHQWTYRTMVHDLFNMRLNRVKVPQKDKKDSEFEIDFDDEFWIKNSSSPFQNVAQNVPQALEKLTAKLNDFNKRAGMNVSDAELLSGDVAKEEKKSDKLALNKDMMEEVFQLAEARKRVDMHTNIAYALLHEVNRRKLDEFVSIEESLIKQKPLEKDVLMSLLDPSEVEKGTLEDKIRLLCISYLHYLQKQQQGSPEKSEISKQQIEQQETLLQREREKLEQTGQRVGDDAGEDLDNKKCVLPELAFLRSLNIQSLSASGMSKSVSSNTLPSSGKQDFGARTGSFAHLAFNLGGSILENISKGLRDYGNDKNFQLPLTRIVDAIVNFKPQKLQDSEQFVITDPKAPANQSQVRVMTNSIQNGKGAQIGEANTFNDVIVFVVGGGNYMEYQNLTEFFSQQQTRDDHFGVKQQQHFTYGCTDVVTGEQFLEQLRILGEKTASKKK